MRVYRVNNERVTKSEFWGIVRKAMPLGSTEEDYRKIQNQIWKQHVKKIGSTVFESRSRV